MHADQPHVDALAGCLLQLQLTLQHIEHETRAGQVPAHWERVIYRMEMMSLTFFLSVIIADIGMLFFYPDFY